MVQPVTQLPFGAFVIPIDWQSAAHFCDCVCRCHIEDAIAEMEQDPTRNKEFWCQHCEGACAVSHVSHARQVYAYVGTCPEGHLLLNDQVIGTWHECYDCSHYLAPGDTVIACEECWREYYNWSGRGQRPFSPSLLYATCTDKTACKAQSSGIQSSIYFAKSRDSRLPCTM